MPSTSSSTHVLKFNFQPNALGDTSLRRFQTGQAPSVTSLSSSQTAYLKTSKPDISEGELTQNSLLSLKAVEQIIPIHQAQLMTYLKLSNKTLGFLINFNTTYFKSSIKRIANNYQDS